MCHAAVDILAVIASVFNNKSIIFISSQKDSNKGDQCHINNLLLNAH